MINKSPFYYTYTIWLLLITIYSLVNTPLEDMTLLTSTLNETYHPSICHPLFYKLALLRNRYRTQFLIHGLWIEKCQECRECSYPTFCPPVSFFNQTDLTPLYSNLSMDYFPGGDPRYNKLLEHEWIKHGSCTNLTELQFFTRSLQLYRFHQPIIQSNCSLTQKQCFLMFDHNLQPIN